MYIGWDLNDYAPALTINGVYVGCYHKEEIQHIITNKIEPAFNQNGLAGVTQVLEQIRPLPGGYPKLLNGFQITKYEATIQTEIKDIEAKTKPRESGLAIVSLKPINLEGKDELMLIRQVTLVKKGNWEGYYKSEFENELVYWPFVKFIES